MKFATIGHLLIEENIELFPKTWIKENLILSPEMNINGIKGFITCLSLTAQQMMGLPRDVVRLKILDTARYVQNELGVDLIQLGALTTSVTNGGKWLTEQKSYSGFVNHGDSYTAAVTCQAVFKILKLLDKNSSDLVLSIVGAYGVIGEAVSKILVPHFAHSILIGRNEKKLNKLTSYLQGSYETTKNLKTKNAEIIVTATSHPEALLNSEHLKKNAIIVDVSQPPNLSYDVCKKRPDIRRIDGGYVDFPSKIQIPGLPIGKNFACIVEVIMQALENEKENHVGSIDLVYLQKTEKWAQRYGFMLNELTNFGKALQMIV